MSEIHVETSTIGGLLPGAKRRRLLAHQAALAVRRTDTLETHFKNAAYDQDPGRPISRIARPYYAGNMYPILNAEMPSPEAHMFLDELAEGRIILGSLAVSEAAALFMPEYPRLQPLLYGDAVRLRHTVEHQRDGEPGSMNGYYTAVQEVPDAQGAHAILLLPTPEHLPAA